MEKLKWFRNPVRDVRVARIHFGDHMQMEPIRDFGITFWPSFSMWFHRTAGATSVSDDNCSCGLVFRFMFWSIDIFDYRYTRPYRESWVEDRNGNYITTLEKYRKGLRK